MASETVGEVKESKWPKRKERLAECSKALKTVLEQMTPPGEDGRSFCLDLLRLTREELESKEEKKEDYAEKYTLFPIDDQKAYKMFKDLQGVYWTTEEIDMTEDVKQWDSLDPKIREFVEGNFAFFSSIDGLILEGTEEISAKRAKSNSRKLFYAWKAGNEGIHWETYSMILTTLVKDPERLKKLQRAVQDNPAVKGLADFIKKWVNENSTDAEVHAGMGFSELGLFSASFCSFYWLKRRGILPGTTFSNELISRDEGRHGQFEVEVNYASLPTDQRMSQESIHALCEGGYVACTAFVNDILKVDLIGLTCTDMLQYVRFIIDRFLVSMDYDKLYGDKNPFEWMEMISLTGKTNFFEKRVGEYAKNMSAPVTEVTVDVDV